MEHSNSIPSLIYDFEDDYKYDRATYREKLLITMIKNLNNRILALEHDKILEKDE